MVKRKQTTRMGKKSSGDKADMAQLVLWKAF